MGCAIYFDQGYISCDDVIYTLVGEGIITALIYMAL